MTGRTFWLRWSLRDARARWVQILATALVLALGVGAYSGLGGIRGWREASAATSFRAAGYHDLRVTLGQGDYAPVGRLRAALRDVPVAAAQERLVADTQVDASGDGRSALVRGRLVGVDVRAQGVDRLVAKAGRTLEPADAGRHVAVLESAFAAAHGLPATGRLTLGDGATMPYVGLGMHPQTYLVVDQGVSGAESRLAYVFVPLAEAGRVTGHPGQVNEVALRLRPGADGAAAERAVNRALPGATITRGTDEDAYRVLSRDARNDQRLYRLFAVLVIAAAGFATFNLIGRAVDAQRREIGIGMALGVPPARLAIRPLLMAAQIGAAGALLSVGIGIGSAALLKGALSDAYPLPHYASGVQWGGYPFGIAVALLLPLVAAVPPVRRSVRLRPVEAIDVSARAGSSARGGWASRIAVPGRSLAQMPVRNLARAPHRTLVTALGLAGVIAAVLAILGMVDSFQATADRTRTEVLRTAPARVVATLGGFERTGSPAVRSVLAVPEAAHATAGLTVGVTARSGGERLDLQLTFTQPGALWRPTIAEGSSHGGVALSRKAADDLGVGVGDTVVLRHPARHGDGFSLIDTPVRVTGLHANPQRPYAYADAAQAAALGLGDLVNTVTATPAAGASTAQLERALLQRRGVAAVEPARSGVDTLQDGVDTFVGAIRITIVLTLALAVLIAFGSASLGLEERRREYATMFAFGLPVRSVLGLAIAENALLGLLATLGGGALGVLLLGWIVHDLLGETLPDLGAVVALSPGSVVITLLVGVGSVAAAPLLMRRRLRRMDIPSTLRVVE